MNKITKTIMAIMLITSLTGIALADSLDATSGNTVTQSRLADIVADDYNSKSVPEQQTQVTLTRVTGNSVPQSRTADIVSYDIANSYDGSGYSSSSYVPSALPDITSVPAEITHILILDVIPTPTPVPTIPPTKRMIKDLQSKGIDYDLQLSGQDNEVQWGNFCFNVIPNNSEVRIKGVVHTQLCPSRDFKPGLYLVNISHEGYHNFSQMIALDNEELKDINVSLEAITEEVPVVILEQNGSVTGQAQNENNATSASQPNDGISPAIWSVLGGLAGIAIGTAAVLLLRRKTTASQDIATDEDDIGEVAANPKTIEEDKRKILSIIKNNPMDITDEEILSNLEEIYGLKISGRTLSRRKAELKKENPEAFK